MKQGTTIEMAGARITGFHILAKISVPFMQSLNSMYKDRIIAHHNKSSPESHLIQKPIYDETVGFYLGNVYFPHLPFNHLLIEFFGEDFWLKMDAVCTSNIVYEKNLEFEDTPFVFEQHYPQIIFFPMFGMMNLRMDQNASPIIQKANNLTQAFIQDPKSQNVRFHLPIDNILHECHEYWKSRR